MMLNQKNKRNYSFTLIELLVAMTIFIVVIAVVGIIFLNSFFGQRRSLAFEIIFEQNSYLMEYMSRALRMAKKQTPSLPSCLSQNGLSYEFGHSGQGIKFINSRSECQEFYFEDSTKRLKENRAGQEHYLTAANTEVLFFTINLSGQSDSDLLQPKATIFLSLKKSGGKAESQSVLRVQTTVSQRKLDIQQ